MTGALLTTFFFALSAVCGQRIAHFMGSYRANFWRLLASSAILTGILLLFYRSSFHPSTFAWFFVSGIVGFGIGDVALFLAYERLGARLTVLINLCLAPVFAALAEWLWLGNPIPPIQMAAAATILAGVAMAVRPGHSRMPRRGTFKAGVIAAVIAGFGQGVGAVISRHAHEIETAVGVDVNGISEAGQRVLGGFLIAAIAFAVRRKAGLSIPPRTGAAGERSHLARWLLGAALAGPVIGVSCYQWALEGMESGLVLAVVATTPIVIMPLAWLSEGDRPGPASLLGAAIAVGGVIFLTFSH